MTYSFDTVKLALGDNERFARARSLISELEALGQFKVKHRFDPTFLAVQSRADFPDHVREAVILDTEATGKDASVAGLLELGMVKFVYDPKTFEVLGVTGVFSEMHDPGMPIDPEASLVNGITQEMVEGKSIDPQSVADFVAGAVLIIAHNAPYDRVLSERYFPFFAGFAWACSYREVDWVRTWGPGASLESLANKQDFYFEAHRAFTDCYALLRVLATPSPAESGMPTGLEQLVTTARKAQTRIWATNAQFDLTPLLKARGYGWNPGTAPGSTKAWHIAKTAEEMAEELEYLRSQIYKRATISLPTERLTALIRHSARFNPPSYITWPAEEPAAQG